MEGCSTSWYDVLVDSENGLHRKDTRRARRAAAAQCSWDIESASPTKAPKLRNDFLLTLALCVIGGVGFIAVALMPTSTVVTQIPQLPIGMMSAPGIRVPLNSNNLLEVEVGGQKLQLALDTVSGRTWMPTTACTAASCKKHKLLNPTVSTSFKSLDISEHTSTFEGTLATDDINLLPEVKVEQVELWSVYDVPGHSLYDTSLWDGTLGLGFPNKMDSGSSLVGRLYKQGYITSQVFSVKFGRNGDGFIEFGGGGKFDQGKGGLSQKRLSPSETWEVNLQRYSVGSSPLTLEAGAATIDLLSSTVVIPEENLRLMAEVLDLDALNVDSMKSKPALVQPGHLMFETRCSRAKSLPPVKMVLGVESENSELVLTPEEYLVPVDESQNTCIFAFSSRMDQTNNNLVTLGSPVLQKYEVIFDMSSGRVAFR